MVRNSMLRARFPRFLSLVLGALLVVGVALPVAAQDADGDTGAADLRVTLSRLLGEHGTLAIKAMRSGGALTHGPGASQAGPGLATAALVTKAAELVTLLAAWLLHRRA